MNNKGTEIFFDSNHPHIFYILLKNLADSKEVKMKIISKNSADSILLVLVKAFTVISGILSTAILSRALSLELYGTYSQLNLVVTTTTSLTALGLIDAVNYYYNKTHNRQEQKEYLDTIEGVQVIIGFGAGLAILICNRIIINYFENELLAPLLIYIAFRPMFANIVTGLQILQVSVGRAKAVAVRNAILSILRLGAILITAYVTYDIKTILITFIVFEIVVALYFKFTFEKEQFKISWYKINWTKAKEILLYSIPMGIYIMTNSLSRDMDKLVIGKFCGTEQLAIYSNCSTLLPFDIVSSAFLTIIVPIMTRYINSKEIVKGRTLFKNYFRIGYITTFTFTIASMILSREMILMLYGEKYLSGQSIFILYTIVDMLKFANLSLVLTANGETKTLMKYSISALIANFILNILFYIIFGFVGPAIATVIITGILSFVLTKRSAMILGTLIRELIDWKEFISFVGMAGGMGIGLFIVERVMARAAINYMIILVVLGGTYISGVLLTNSRRLISAMKEIK